MIDIKKAYFVIASLRVGLCDRAWQSVSYLRSLCYQRDCHGTQVHKPTLQFLAMTGAYCF